MSLQPFERLDAIAVPITQPNLDTDQLLPARYLQKPRANNFGEFLFRDLRFGKDGSEQPGFVLNRPAYRDGRIIVAERNFGCGSSREHAVWALHDYGFKVVISPRFADIFRGNSLKAGLLTVELAEKIVQRLWDDIEQDPTTQVTVDLVERQVRWSGEVHDFDLDDYSRWRLMEGLDDISLTLRHADDITRYEAGRPAWLPVAG